MKTGKLALLAALMSALTLGGLAAPAAALAPTVQATDPAGEALSETTGPADPSQPAPVSETPASVPGASGVPGEAVLPSMEASIPPAGVAETAESAGEPVDDGYEYVPVGEGHVVPGPDSPLITEADGSVRPAVETTEEHASSARSVDGPASMLSAAARAGNIKVTLVRATVHGNGSLVDLNAARNSISSANAYWRTMSSNRLSMSIVSEKVHYSASAYASDDYATMMNKIARELKWVDSPYTALVVFVPTADLNSGGYGGILGGGWTTGGTAGRILMPAPSSFTNNVVTHEVGHVLGLLHANSLQCTNGRSDVSRAANGRWSDGACSSREYGDTTDLMGSAQYNQPVINSYFWDVGKFGNGNEILNAGRITGSKTYTLRPWGGSSVNRAVKFTDPASGEVYYLELRQPAGYDQHLEWGPAGNRGVKIVKADAVNTWSVFSLIIPPSTRPFAGYYNNNHTWQAGQTFTTHAGTEVRINSVSASSASITIIGDAAEGAIADARASNPALGAATSPVVRGIKDSGAYQNFQGGAILWSKATGAQVSLNGAFRDAYQSYGFETGALGYPTSGEVSIPGGGKFQDFQGGAILWTKTTGAQVSLKGPIRDAYQKQGFEAGALKYPTSGEVNIPGGGKFQDFQGGAILWTKTTGAQVSLKGPIRDAYQSYGFEAGALGYPTSGEVNIPGGGKFQDFQGGAILWTKTTGAQVSLKGPIRDAYQKQGFEAGALKYPTSGEVNIPGGGKFQDFQGGAILWTKTTGAQVSLKGPIRDAYQKQGFEAGALKYPTSGEVNIPGGGKFQDFQGGAILWTKTTGAQVSLKGPIRDAYQKQGFEAGALKYPTSGEVNIPGGGKFQDFQGGAILWTKTTGAQVSLKGPIRDAYQKQGFEAGALKYPTSGEVNIPGGGKFQDFQGGAILWTKTTGAQVSKNGPIRTAYQNQGFEAGRLGYPTSGEYKSAGNTVQDFQGGRISLSSNGKVTVSYK